jgi:hypothetical protein
VTLRISLGHAGSDQMLVALTCASSGCAQDTTDIEALGSLLLAHEYAGRGTPDVSAPTPLRKSLNRARKLAGARADTKPARKLADANPGFRGSNPRIHPLGNPGLAKLEAGVVT